MNMISCILFLSLDRDLNTVKRTNYNTLLYEVMTGPSIKGH